MMRRRGFRLLASIIGLGVLTAVSTAALAAQGVATAAGRGDIDLRGLALTIMSLTAAAVGVPYGRRLWRSPETGGSEVMSDVRSYLQRSEHIQTQLIERIESDRRLLEERRETDRRQSDKVMQTLDRIIERLDTHERKADERAERIIEEGRR